MASKPTIVLGISSSHGDSSAALVVDGCLIAAVEEERFTRVKHYALFPKYSVEYCLRHANLSPREVQAVAIARRPSNALGRKIALVASHPNLLSMKRPLAKADIQKPIGHYLKQAGLKRAKLFRVEHHAAHLMSARYLADNRDMALLSFDGLGDFVSTAIGQATQSQLNVLDRVYFPHSVGYFYTAMTQYLGFAHFGDEFKVMGLSGYGQPRYLNAMRELIRETDDFGFQLNLEAFPILKNPMTFYIEKAQPKIQPFYSASLLTQVIGIAPRKVTENLTAAHADLAKSVQTRFEEIANHLLHQLFDKAGGGSLGLAGGCAHNSVWVGKISQQTRFKEIFVAPACHDAGTAVGAAIAASGVQVSPEGNHWGLLGPAETEQSLTAPESLPSHITQQHFKQDTDLIQWIVEQLCSGRIVGLCRGRMEFGPRALGCRSILADPRIASMKDRLNERVKHRESFRPFAASVLWEHQQKWFHNSFYVPSMEAVFEVSESVRSRVPAIVHADNSCRIQSIVQHTQPFFWSLLECFRKRTGIPMLINTSFNDGEPIVCTEKDAIDCFLNCDMDALVIGNQTYLRIAESAATAS
ncbi:MAG: carbamoyltransferase [Deltaproteobacteria bacterium]|nr:carbamoyltransferase [Deltaproteobacteria bacterium]